MDQTRNIPPEDDAWVEGLLRSDAHTFASDYLQDDGFTGKVMAALPAPVTLPAWRRPALVALWALAAAGLAFFLPGAVVEVLSEAVGMIFAHRFTMHEIVTVLLGVSAATWVGGVYVLRQG